MDEKFRIDGFIRNNESVTDIVIKVPKDSNITENDLEYIKPRQINENEVEMSIEMFMASLCDTIRIPVDDKIKTIEVKNRYYDAGLPGIIVELGNCIEIQDI